MKTKIFAAAILLSSVSLGAEDGELLFGAKYTEGGGSGYGDNVADATKGGTSSMPASAYVNYASTSSLAGVPFDSMAESKTGTYNITGAQSSAAGLSLTDGFTFGSNLYINTDTNWQIFSAISIGGVEFSLQNTQTATGISLSCINVNNADGHKSLGSLNGAGDYTLMSYFVTGKYDTGTNQLTLSVNFFDVHGNLVGSTSSSFDSVTTSPDAGGATFTFDGTEEVGFRGNGYSSSNDKNNGGLYVSNVGLWSGVATEEQMSAFAVGTGYGNHDISEFQIIPEPTTASLSLLALAGLMARRRRKSA